MAFPSLTAYAANNGQLMTGNPVSAGLDRAVDRVDRDRVYGASRIDASGKGWSLTEQAHAQYMDSAKFDAEVSSPSGGSGGGCGGIIVVYRGYMNSTR